MRRAFDISVRTLLVGLLTVELTLAMGVTSWLWYSRGHAAVTDVQFQLVDQLVRRHSARVRRFLAAPHRAGAVMEALWEQGAIDMEHVEANSEVLLRVLEAFDDITYVDVGTPEGDMLSVSRTDFGYEFDLRNAATGGLMFHGKVSSSGEMAPESTWAEVGPFDASIRPWYVRAAEAGAGTWSPIYEFIGPDPLLGISASRPVYGESGALLGVLSSDFALFRIDAWLRSQPVGRTGRAYLMEESGDLIANSSTKSAARRIGGETVRWKAWDHPDHLIGGSAAWIVEQDRQDTRVGSTVLEGERVLIRRALLEDDFGLRMWLVVVVPESDFTGSIDDNARITWWLFVCVLTVVFWTVDRTTRGMGKVVREVSEDMVALSRFEITGVRRPTSTLAEIRAIQDGVEALKVVLSSFAKYVPAEVVGGVVRQKLQAQVHLEPAEVTVAFTSIDDFHDVIETVPSATLMSLLTPYYEISAEAIERSGGLVDKYMDDAVMAFWNAPMPVDEHPAAACQAALRAVARLEKSSEQWRSRGLPPLRVRWGLHCGDVRVGNLGATDRLSYTVLGDTVNVSSRVASLARRYGAQVLVSESVMEAVGDAFLLRPVDRVRVKGRSRSLVIYELMAERGLATPQQQELAARTSEAFALYQQRSFREARVMLDGLLERHRHDGPAKMLREACFAFEANPPPSDWAGERVMRSKS